MKSSRCSISSNLQPGIAPRLWQLTQTLWVGAHLGYLLLFMPVLRQMGLAPLLVAEVEHKLWPGLLVLAVLCLLLQWTLLWRCLSRRRWLRDARSLLLAVALLCSVLMLLAFSAGMPVSLLLNLFHGALLGCGLLLLMQLPPGLPATVSA